MTACAERYEGTRGLIRPGEAQVVHHETMEQSNTDDS